MLETAGGADDATGQQLIEELARWRAQNERGGWRTRWRRRPVWLAQVAQRAGLQLQATAPLFFGARMRVVTGEVMSSAILTFGYSEVALTALLLRVLRAGDGVVDVGTHFGYEAVLASRLVGPSGFVIAFEPNPDAAAIASRNLAPYGQASLRGAAAGERPGRLRFARTSLARAAFAGAAGRTLRNAGDAEEIEVDVTTLDDVVSEARRVRLVKIDVEGAEPAVLRGADRLLRRDRPLIVAEADTPEAGDVLAELLAPYGYRAFTFDDVLGQGFRIAPRGAFAVGHANLLFATAEEPLVRGL